MPAPSTDNHSMSRIERLKGAGLQLASRLPLYKAIPIARYRDYAAIHFMTRTSPAEIPGYLSRVNRVPDWRASSLVVSAQALFANGDDAKARSFALRAVDINPAAPDAWLALSDLEASVGNFADAFRHAYDAWLLDPESRSAATKTVRMSYLAKARQEADAMACLALRRFPDSSKLLWTACKHSRTEKQLSDIHEIWHGTSSDPRHVSLGARPLALGALHLGLYKQAMETYINACLIEARGLGVGSTVKSKQLAGKNSLSVLQDLRDALESRNIPFFFAAGTALGIVRDGRPLDHDDDIDVGVYQEHWSREQLIRVFEAHRNFMVEPTMAETSKIRLTHRGGAGIDIFRFYREGEHVYHDGNFVRWRNTPFSIDPHHNDDGSIHYLPSDTDRYLTENYGDWRTPDPHFDAFVEGPNVEVTCMPYMQIHRVRRAYKMIRAGDVARARAELDHVETDLRQTETGHALLEELSS